MSTLDDKILGEKLEYYCSSDEEADEEDDGEEYGDAVSELDPYDNNQALGRNTITADQNSKTTSNTGPKGVIKDWQRFKQLETEKRADDEKERVRLAQKLSLTCRSALDDEAEDELDELFSDKVLLEFAKIRMDELMSAHTFSDKVFGSLVHLRSGEEYLQAIDKEVNSVTVILHVFEDYVKSCRLMNSCLDQLSRSFPHIKFCKMSASTAGLSTNFKSVGVPALLIYKAGDLIGNFVSLGEEFGQDITPNDVENFLQDKGIFLSKVN